MSQSAIVSISIVSHGQASLIAQLLQDLKAHCATPVEVILTLNIPELIPFDIGQFGFPVELIQNDQKKGFAANHNAAFRKVRTEFFCVLNPDIRLESDPFPALLAQLCRRRAGLVAPAVSDPDGEIEDNARRFPTPLSILRKLVLRKPPLDYQLGTKPLFPDWVAGMFVVFRTELFLELAGFDEAYFLYYEDVDLCWRLRLRGYDVVLVPEVRVIHAARRASHRNLRYFAWHVSSMLRYFFKRYRNCVGG